MAAPNLLSSKIRHLQWFSWVLHHAVANKTPSFLSSLWILWANVEKNSWISKLMILGTFRELLQGGRGEFRNLIGTQTDWIYEDLLWNSPKNFTPKTTLQSKLKHPWISKKWSNLSVLCVINSNVPWLCHEILRQILPPWGRAPICPLRKGNTSPEIRLPH